MSNFYVPSPQYKLTQADGRPTDDYYRFFAGLQAIFGLNGVLIPSAGGTGVNNGNAELQLAGSLTIASNGGTIVFPAPATTQTMPSTSKTLLATDFSNASGVLGVTHGGTGNTTGQPSGSAGGDLSGSYPSPTVAKINGAGLGATTATSAHILVADGSAWQSVAMSGGATITTAGVVTLSGSLPPNGSAGGDLSGSYPNPTVAKINGASLGTTTATAAHILVADGSAWQSVAVSGAASITTAGVFSITHGASAEATGSSLGSTSGTGTMLGLKGSITPLTTGTVEFIIAGSAHHSNAGGTLNHQIRYGTGTAPNNGDALTGTAVGQKLGMQSANAGTKGQIVNLARVTGLSVGTTYWYDISLDNAGAGTATVDLITGDAYEQ